MPISYTYFTQRYFVLNKILKPSTRINGIVATCWFILYSYRMRRINRCLNKQLLTLCQQAVILDDLNLALNTYLPASLQDKCRVGSFNKGCLVIATTWPAIMTELRYCLPELRDRLRKEARLYQLMSIKLHLIVDEYPIQKHTANIFRPELSSKARATVQQAGELCSYEPLKKALFRLATTQKS